MTCRTGFSVDSTLDLFFSPLHCQIYEKKLYGPIYRGATNHICVNTPQLLEEVLRNDNKLPSRGDMAVWKEYRDMRGFGYGLFTE